MIPSRTCNLNRNRNHTCSIPGAVTRIRTHQDYKTKAKRSSIDLEPLAQRYALYLKVVAEDKTVLQQDKASMDIELARMQDFAAYKLVEVNAPSPYMTVPFGGDPDDYLVKADEAIKCEPEDAFK